MLRRYRDGWYYWRWFLVMFTVTLFLRLGVLVQTALENPAYIPVQIAITVQKASFFFLLSLFFGCDRRFIVE